MQSPDIFPVDLTTLEDSFPRGFAVGVWFPEEVDPALVSRELEYVNTVVQQAMSDKDAYGCIDPYRFLCKQRGESWWGWLAEWEPTDSFCWEGVAWRGWMRRAFFTDPSAPQMEAAASKAYFLLSISSVFGSNLPSATGLVWAQWPTSLNGEPHPLAVEGPRTQYRSSIVSYDASDGLSSSRFPPVAPRAEILLRGPQPTGDRKQTTSDLRDKHSVVFYFKETFEAQVRSSMVDGGPPPRDPTASLEFSLRKESADVSQVTDRRCVDGYTLMGIGTWRCMRQSKELERKLRTAPLHSAGRTRF